MSSAHNTWRRHPFVLGRHCLATASFGGLLASMFVEGQTYELQDVSSSRYDG